MAFRGKCNVTKIQTGLSLDGLFVILKWSEVSPDILVCRSLLDCDTIEERTEVLKDWLHPKAPGTLLKRVNSLLRYHKSEGWSDEVFPYKENKVYDYMASARAGGAKPSQMRTLREAIIFARHVFSLPELDVVISSRRCLGASMRGAKQGARKRADPPDSEEPPPLTFDSEGHWCASVG